MASKFRYKNSKIWHLKWYASGVEHRESTRTSDARVASYLLAKKEQELAEGRFPGFLRDIPLKQAVSEYCKEIKTYCTKKTYSTDYATTNAFLKKIGPHNLKDITGKTIEDYLIWRIEEKNITMTTRNSLLRYLHAFFSWCVRKGYIVRNPADGLQKVKVPKLAPKYWTWDEAHRLLVESRNTDHKLNLHSYVATGLYSGLRLGELLNLEWQDIDFQNKRIYVRNRPEKGFVTKTKEERDMRLNKHLAMILERYRQASGPCFDKKNFRKRFTALCTLAKLPPRSHSMRHTIGTQMLTQAIQEAIKQIAKGYGHSGIRTTEGYAKLTPQILDQMIDSLDFENPPRDR